MRYPILAAALLLAAPGLAQLDPDPDGIGVYFDEGATVVATTAPVFSEVAAYLIATHPGQSGALAMWEWHVQAAGAFAVVTGAPRNGANVATNMPGSNGYMFTVFGAPPLPPLTPVTVLADVWIVPVEGGRVDLLLGPSYYRVDDAFSPPDHELFPSSGSHDLPVAVINGEPPVTAHAMVWGGVKSLFR